MKMKDLYLMWNNLSLQVQVQVVVPGAETYTGELGVIFDDIKDRLVQWFAFRDDLFIIKLVRCE